MNIFLIFVMLFNINHHANNSFFHLKYTSRAVATLPCDDVEQPSVRAGFFIMELTQEYVKSLFDYREDGRLIWKIKPSQIVTKGAVAGTINTTDKRKVKHRCIVIIKRHAYYNSRLVFLWHKGYLPEQVDHKDRNSLNDRIKNLRAASKSQNQVNKSSRPGSTSQYLGVHWCKQRSKWVASITVTPNSKRSKNLGGFINEKDAAIAYNEAARVIYGEFANLNIL